MHPVLFQLGPVTIYTYGCWWRRSVSWSGCCRRTGSSARGTRSETGLEPRHLWNSRRAGRSSKLWLIFSAWDYYAANPREIFSIATLQSAGTFYGGVLGASPLALSCTRIFRRCRFSRVLDLAAGPVALGHAIGRLGCFAAGCCYGKPTSLPWGVTFTDPIAARIAGTPLNVSLHPTQLYEAGAEFLNFLFLVWLGTRQRFAGQMVGAYFMLYGIERGAIEFLRGDPGRTMMFHDAVSLMQIVSLGLVLTGAYLWWRGLRGAAPIQPAAPARVAEGRS